MQTKILALFCFANSWYVLVSAIDINNVTTQQQQQLQLQQQQQHRIVNGQDANIEDFPFQLSLRRNGIHICGAAVLSSLWALTAAHCVDNHEGSAGVFTLRFGSSLRAKGGTVVPVAEAYAHPAYDSATMNYDVAILLVAMQRLRGDFVAAIALPATEEAIEDNMPATISGWGHMSDTDQILSSVLKYAVVYTVNQTRCAVNLRAHGNITSAMFCAAARNIDACQGDSGGPIQIDGKLVGVVSWGVGCADPYYPGVYTRVAHPPIRNWIRVITRL